MLEEPPGNSSSGDALGSSRARMPVPKVGNELDPGNFTYEISAKEIVNNR
jgi:hypothetical protein